MLNKLLQTEVTAFIKKYENSDLDRLLFTKNKYPAIPIDLVVNQIRARQKAKHKMPLWYSTKDVIMPPLLSMEQSSSEEAAAYKSNLFQGELAIDLTGGAGVDAYYLSKRFKKVIYIDLNKDLAEIARYNFNKLGATNIEVINGLSENFLKEFKLKADLIYIDPARRDQNQKLFLLEECSPNIIELQEELLKKADTVLVKASPMLDIAKGISQLHNVDQIHIVAIKNEVKELLFIQKSENRNTAKVTAIDLAYNQPYEFDWNSINKTRIGNIEAYLYEPNAAILKSGKPDELCSRFNLLKLNNNTNLFTSSNLEKDFPGRYFKIDKILKYDKKEIRKNIPSMKANIATRNFPDSVEVVRKRTGIEVGGDIYLFGIRDYEDKVKILLCSKI